MQVVEPAMMLADPSTADLHRPIGQWVAACLEVDPDVTLTADGVRAIDLERLARYKVPEQIELVEHLPHNAMGKIQRAPLQERLARQEKG